MTNNRDTADWGRFQPQRRNLIINGGYNIWQRGTTFAAPTTDAYSADRWKWGVTGTAVTTHRELSNTGVPEGQASAYEIEVTTADASLAAGDHGIHYQVIEGYDIIALGWHLADQSKKKDLTLSFYSAHVKTGTHCVSVRNNSINRSYVAEYTQAITGAWEKHTITIPAPTDGTWEIGTGKGIQLAFCLVSGSTFLTTANTWGTSNYIATSNQVNNFDSTSNFFRISGVQLEIGTEATDFEYRHFGDELALCQRYYEKSYDIDVAPGTITTSGFWNFYLSGITTVIHATAAYIHFAVPKRAVTYTLIAYSDATGDSGKLRDSVGPANDITPTLDGQGTGSFRIVATGKSANAISISGHWTCDAEL